jgi:glycosyltransferase involved in cell wall biosynthesis
MEKTASTIISCIAPYGGGGLGQHFSYIVEEERQRGALREYYGRAIKPGDEAIAACVKSRFTPLLARYTPLRFSPGAINHLENDMFDKRVAARLSRPIDKFIGFGGQSLRSFRAARELGAQRLELVAANSHVDNVARLHEKAIARYPIESSWLSAAQRSKTLAEYEMADLLHVASEYSMRIFSAHGIPQGKLRRVEYPVDPRFSPREAKELDDGVFRIVYCGSITVMKGVPDLLEAFARLNVKRSELTLVGGTGTRGMRRYLEAAMARDGRIKLSPGDPLPHLRRADVYVHPSYEDNLGYAALEAIRAGVPAVLTSDTGAKEYIESGVNGFIVPTGDIDALVDRLRELRKSPLLVEAN